MNSTSLQKTADLFTDGDWVESKDQDPNGDVRLIQLADIGIGKFINKSSRYLTSKTAKRLRGTYLQPGDILIARMPDPIGRACIFPELDQPCITAVDVTILRVTKGVEREYLMHQINSPDFKHKVLMHAKGATRKRISRKNLGKLSVDLPSLDEQRRIVTRIKECMERAEEINGNEVVIAEELKALFPAVLHERFAELSNDFSVDVLENVAEIKGGGSLPKGTTQDTGDDCVLLVKVGDMNEPGNERIIKVSRGYISAEKAGKKVALPGSVIFPKRGGAIATNKKRMLGRAALIDPNLMAVVAHPKKLRPEYLYYWTQTIDLAQISNGGVIPQLNRKDLVPLEIPLPDLDHQDSVINEFEQVDASCFELQVTFNEANLERAALRESILRKAFAGEL